MAKSKNKKSKLFLYQERAKTGGICDSCRKPFLKVTVDHIVPVSILDMLDETGEAKYEMEDNFQFLCNICNAFKANRLEKRNPKTKEILLNLLK